MERVQIARADSKQRRPWRGWVIRGREISICVPSSTAAAGLSLYSYAHVPRLLPWRLAGLLYDCSTWWWRSWISARHHQVMKLYGRPNPQHMAVLRFSFSLSSCWEKKKRVWWNSKKNHYIAPLFLRLLSVLFRLFLFSLSFFGRTQQLGRVVV